VELFVSCGKGVILSGSPPTPPPAQVHPYPASTVNYRETFSYRSNNYPYGNWWDVTNDTPWLYHSKTSYWNGSFTVYDWFEICLSFYFNPVIPNGATILSAYIKITSDSVPSPSRCYAPGNFTIKAWDEANAAFPTFNSYPTPTDGTGFTCHGPGAVDSPVRSITSAQGTLVIPAGDYTGTSTIFTTGDLSPIIQGIVNKPGWVSGSRMGFFPYWSGSQIYNDAIFNPTPGQFGPVYITPQSDPDFNKVPKLYVSYV